MRAASRLGQLSSTQGRVSDFQDFWGFRECAKCFRARGDVRHGTRSNPGRGFGGMDGSGSGHRVRVRVRFGKVLVRVRVRGPACRQAPLLLGSWDSRILGSQHTHWHRNLHALATLCTVRSACSLWAPLVLISSRSPQQASARAARTPEPRGARDRTIRCPLTMYSTNTSCVLATWLSAGSPHAGGIRTSTTGVALDHRAGYIPRQETHGP